MRKLFSSATTWIAIIAASFFVLYGYGHYQKFRDFNIYEGIPLASAAFAAFLNIFLLIKILLLENADFGKLQNDRGSLTLAVIISTFFASATVVRELAKVFF